jgi:(2Fe-2S) ferredoxin
LWHKNVDEETADEVIRRHEAQGWRLNMRMIYPKKHAERFHCAAACEITQLW